MVPFDQALSRTLAQSLREKGIDAVDARDLLVRSGSPEGAYDASLRDGRTLVAWDVDYADPRRFPLSFDVRPLIVGFDPTTEVAVLAERVADILSTLEASGTPHRVLVLEPRREAVSKPCGDRVLKRAA